MPPKRRGFSSSDDSDDDIPVRRRGTAANTSKKPAPAVVQKRASPKKSPKKEKRSPTKKETSTSALTADPLIGNRNNDSSDEEDLEERVTYDVENLLNIEVPPPPEPCMSADGTGERLMIKDIMVTNFKSYFGTQRIGPFHTNYTAIVGPNGSGKSNVIDSLLFVFGYKASKIRSKKLSVLIHSSAGRDNIASCTVEVHFQKIVDKPSGGFEVVAGSQFYVSRTAFKDNTSKYTINGRTSSFKDVATTLKEVGIDLVHNRFLILQGEVEQIAMMKPKADEKGGEGMLEYLEDIIGTSRYKEPLEKLDKKVETLTEDVSNQARRLAHATSEKERLEGPVKEMMEFMKIENKLAIVKNKIALRKTLGWRSDLDQLKSETLVAAEKEKEEAGEKMKSVLAKQKEQKKQTAHLEKEQTKAQADLDRVSADIGAEEQREAKRKNDKKRIAKDLEKMEADREKEQKKLQDFDNLPEKSKKKIEAARKVIEEMTQEEKDAQERLDENQEIYKERTEDDRETKTKCEEAYGTANQKVVELRGEVDNLKMELRGVTDKLGRSTRQVETTRGALEAARRTLEEKQTELEASQVELPEKERELREARDRAAQLKKDDDALNRDISALRGKLLDEQRYANEVSGGSRLVKGLMKAKKDGRIPGILGRLGDLGGIDPKYDVAASTASSAFDHIVVEDVRTSQMCFDLARQEQLGVVNVLIMEKLGRFAQQADQNANRQFPLGLPRLFDLIQFTDPRLKCCFYFAVRDTLVAENTEQASKAAFFGPRDRHRVVTLQGALLDGAGTITGGGRPQRGKIGQTAKVDNSRDSNKIIEDMTTELQGKETQIQQVKAEARYVDNRIRTLSDRVKVLQDAIRKLTSDVKNATTTVTSTERNLANFEKQMENDKQKVDGKKVKEFEGKIAKAENEQKDAQKIADEAKARVAEVDERLDAVKKELLTLYEDTIADSKKKRQAAETTVTKEQAALNSADRNKKKTAQRVQELDNDLKERRAELEALENGREAFELEVEKLKEKKEKLEKIIAETEDALKALRKEHSTLDKDEVELQKTLKEAEASVKEVKEDIAKLTHAIRKADEERTKYVTHDIAGLKVDQAKMNDNASRKEQRKQLLDIDEDERFFRMGGNAASNIQEEDGESIDHYMDRIQKNKDELGVEIDQIREDCEKRRKDLMDKMELDEKERLAKLVKEQQSPVMTGVLPTYTTEEIAEFDPEELDFNLKTLEQRYTGRKDKGNLNFGLVEEYKTKLSKYERETKAMDDVQTLKKKHEEKYVDLNLKRLGEFMKSFNEIKEYVKMMYQMLTIGGNAQLEVKDVIRPFEHGVQFMVRPPKKSWKRIQNLSGGEKTLSSLALVFALHKFRPTPLYVMDEIDAALDFRNVSIIGHYVKERTKNAQFVIISLRNNMFELSDRLVGIYKVSDCTRHVVVEPNGVLVKARPLQVAISKVNQKHQGDYEDELVDIDVNKDTRGDKTRKRVSNGSPVSKPRPPKESRQRRENEN